MTDPTLVVLLGQVQRVVNGAYDDLEDAVGKTMTPPPPGVLESIVGNAMALIEWGGRQIVCRVNIELETPLTPAELPAESDEHL